MEKKLKLVKVTMEFTDKTQWLGGKEAQEWFEAVNDQCVLGFMHGNEIKSFPRKVKKGGK